MNPVDGDRARVLCVDDEPNVLEGLRRVLRNSFEITVSAGANEALTCLGQSEEFAVIVSDLRMPVMDGITFFERAREIAPDSTRVLLTGNADLQSALDAVNRGAVFKYLTKPCSPAVLHREIHAAAEQYRHTVDSRALLDQILEGSIKALSEVLALSNPVGFRRATRVKGIVAAIAERLGYTEHWPVEMAAVLSPIGTLGLPPDTLAKLYAGGRLTYLERKHVERLPRVAGDLIASIPRLDEVTEILVHQNLRFDGGAGRNAPLGDAIPWGARLLKVVFDFDLVESQGLSPAAAIGVLRGREGWYDPDFLAALAEHCGYGSAAQRVIEIELAETRAGMIFMEDLRTTTGIMLLARGHVVTDRLAQRIRSSLHMLEARQKVRVVVPDRSAAEQPDPMIEPVSALPSCSPPGSKRERFVS